MSREPHLDVAGPGEMSAGAGAWGSVPFPEDLYGSAKRVRVLREWIDAERPRRASGPLSLLDFGCGTGAAVAEPLSTAGDQVQGVDLHGPSVERARQRPGGTRVHYSTRTLAQLEADGERYHAIVCSEVLEHLPDPAAALHAFHRLLEPEGLLLVTIPNGFGPFENLQRLDRLLRRFYVGLVLDQVAWGLRAIHWQLRGRGLPPRPGEAPTGIPGAASLNPDSPHVQFFHLPELEGLCATAGFVTEEVRSRVVVCGPYVDFWAPLFSLGGRLYALNAALADRLPLSWTSDWMLRLRRR